MGEQSKTPVRWTDSDYAQALNNREPGDLPQRNETGILIDVDDVVEVAIGQLLLNLRNQGRVNRAEQVLLDALVRHGLYPISKPGERNRWFLPPADGRVAWPDHVYAAAFDSRDPGDLPEVWQVDPVLVDGHVEDIPTGLLLQTLRSRGRAREGAEQVLSVALARHDLHPHLPPQGPQPLVPPLTGDRVHWTDAWGGATDQPSSPPRRSWPDQFTT